MKTIKRIQDDLWLFSSLAGVVGSLVRAINTLIAYSLHLSHEITFVVFAQIIFRVPEIPFEWAYFGQLMLGFLAYTAMGGMLIIPLSLIYLRFGTDFYLVKGTFFGVAVWVIIRNVFLFSIMPKKPLDLGTVIFSFIGHLLYGLVSAYLIVRYGRFLPPTNTKENK